MKSYRHEQKYYISHAEYEVLSRKLTLTMARDKFAVAEYGGKYFIRSLYFDDHQDSALRQKLDGTDSRNKYRIRIYNLSDKTIKLERKHKEGQFILKDSLSLTRQECDALIAGQPSFLLQRRERFAKELYAAFRINQLKPRVLVDYWREAYLFPQEDVRITFDSDLRTAMRATDLFNPNLPTYPAGEKYGMVMEVKFNQFLPAYIRELIQPAAAQRSAVSKYVFCRRYEF